MSQAGSSREQLVAMAFVSLADTSMVTGAPALVVAVSLFAIGGAVWPTYTDSCPLCSVPLTSRTT